MAPRPPHMALVIGLAWLAAQQIAPLSVGALPPAAAAAARLNLRPVLQLSSTQLRATLKAFPPGSGQFPGRQTLPDGSWESVDREDWVAGALYFVWGTADVCACARNLHAGCTLTPRNSTQA